MKKLLFQLLFLIGIIVFSGCNSISENNNQENQDSIINALNAADTLSKIPQKVMDSINKAYLDSFKKNVDTNNAEFGHPH